MAIADLLKNAGATPTAPSIPSGGVSALLASAKQGSGVVPTTLASTPPAQTPAAPSPSIVSTLLNVPKDFINGLASSYRSAASSIPQDISTASSEISKEQQQPNTLRNEFSQTDSLLKAGGRAAGDFAGAVFAPISSAIGAALKATGAQTLIDDSGNVIANHSGITDMAAFQKFAMEHPNAGEDFQRFMNIALSGGEGSKIEPVKTAEDAKSLAQTIVSDAKKPQETAPAHSEPTNGLQKLIVQAKGVSHETPVAFSNKYTPDAKLPTIDLGTIPRDKSGLPTIQTDAAQSKTGSLNYEPADQSIRNEGAIVKPTESSTPVLPETGKVSKAANDINTKLAQQGLEQIPEEELAKFTPITKADQIVRISTLLDNDPEKAAQMALGHIPVEDGIHPNVLFNAISAAAEKSGNTRLLTDLASSPHAAGSSLHGQGLSAARFMRDPDSAMGNLKRIRDLKIESVGKDIVDKARNVAAKEASKINLSKEDLSWNRFLDKITC